LQKKNYLCVKICSKLEEDRMKRETDEAQRRAMAEKSERKRGVG